MNCIPELSIWRCFRRNLFDAGMCFVLERRERCKMSSSIQVVGLVDSRRLHDALFLISMQFFNVFTYIGAAMTYELRTMTLVRCFHFNFDPLVSFSLITESMEVSSEFMEMTAVLGVPSMVRGESDNQETLFLDDLLMNDVPSLDVLHTDVLGSSAVETALTIDCSTLVVTNTSLNVLGLRALPDKVLSDVRRGEERQPSEHNDRWALRRADSWSSALRWDMSTPLGDLPLEELDKLVSNLFSRAVNVDGNAYPSCTLMNMMNGFNRLIRRASNLRSLRGGENLVDKDFNINSHPVYAKTQMVLRANIKKSAKEGVNKKRNKLELIMEETEAAILSDIDHQITGSHSCQKRLAFYCLVMLGIRGGSELHKLHRANLKVDIDKDGKEFFRFEERQSKNNNYTLDRYNKEQFQKVYHSYEEDFVLCAKQYLRHMPPLEEGTKPDLFLGPMTNHASNVWYNRKHKVSKDKASKWLKSMLELVGLPPDLFSNRSGRATLVTRMAARGVPDEIGMLITGHHMTGGYGRYDRTQDLKMEAVALVSANPAVNYEKALNEVSKIFLCEKVIGSSSNLKTQVDRVSGKAPILSLTKETEGSGAGFMKLLDSPKKLNDWNRGYGEIDWGVVLAKDPGLAKYLGGSGNAPNVVSVGSSMSDNKFENCTINIVCQARKEEDKENIPRVTS